MTTDYSGMELLLYAVIYGFLGWVVKACFAALRDRNFVNSGFLNLPLSISSGITSVILLEVLPTLENHVIYQYIMTFVVMIMVEKLTDQYVRGISGWMGKPSARQRRKPWKVDTAIYLVGAVLYLVCYLLIHPFVFTFVNWLPDLLVRVVTVVLGVVALADYLGVHYTMHTNRVTKNMRRKQDQTQSMARRLSDRIWNRLEKAYPGIDTPQEGAQEYVFARGICFDKLVWVFLISSFLGAGIEMVYCRLMGDDWMNRSSVLYGAFSFVWGFGAVVLTVVLQRLAGKPDRHVFAAGFVVGGVYEYLCSVFTEIVFGTVFWDYSNMPLNIGGRTNVLYCIFWGLLSVMWIKVLYPPMDRWIEKIPPLTGKILTWAIVFVMLCNGLLTAAAMGRYTQRQTDPEPHGLVEEFLDERYDDQWMEQRWPNMKLTEPAGE